MATFTLNEITSFITFRVFEFVAVYTHISKFQNMYSTTKYTLNDYGFKISDRRTRLGHIYFGCTEVHVNSKTSATVRQESGKFSSSVNEAHG